MNKVVYHGSTQIVEEPEIRIAKYNKNFHFGFYCTIMPEQAKIWATRFIGKGFICEYLYNPDDNSMKVLSFSKMADFQKNHIKILKILLKMA